jgi:chromosome partitioning protein
MEERLERDAAGRPRAGFAYFCSQACLARSQDGGEAGVTCDACATRFRLEYASQVVYVAGRRRYACATECRTQILAEASGLRLGEFAPEATPTAEAALPRVLDPGRGEAVVGDPAGAGPPPSGAQRTACRVVAIFNHKGGTGKTTTAVTLAGSLAARGQRVLLVDTDAQGNVAVSLGLRSERSLYHVLVMGLGLQSAVVQARPSLDVLAANETLAAAELYLAGRRRRDRVLAARLAPARDRYDFVVVDCSPSLSLMNQNALCFADQILCPVACDYLSLVGVRQVLRTLKQVHRLLGHPVELFGVLPTMFDARARICHEALETLRQHFGERCLDPVRAAIRVKEAPALGKTVAEHAPGTPVAEDYERVVDRLLGGAHERAARAANA